MLQRIQTVWLLIASLLMGFFTLSDLSVFTNNAGVRLSLSAWSLSVQGGHDLSVSTLWVTGSLSAVILVLILVNIFLYKRRVLQLRLANFIALLEIGLITWLVYLHWSITTSFGVNIGIKVPLSFPLICFILQILAIRGILADEVLVRISRRLR